jgi:hypothetical protein
MNKMKLLVLAGALALGVIATTSTAFAQFTHTAPPTTPGCQVNCEPSGDPDSPGDPFDPFGDPDGGKDGGPDGGPDDPNDGGKGPDPDCDQDCDPNDDPKKPGGGPKKPGGGSQALGGDCGDKLGLLRRVTPDQIAGVGSDSLVDVVPVCRSKALAAEQEEVAQLRPVIGQNQVLDHELGKKGFDPENVVGVIVNGAQVVLYVHPI